MLACVFVRGLDVHREREGTYTLAAACGLKHDTHHCVAGQRLLCDANRVEKSLAAGGQLKALQVILRVEAPGFESLQCAGVCVCG